MGFEPTRAEPNGLAVHRLNHSATSSWAMEWSLKGLKPNTDGMTIEIFMKTQSNVPHPILIALSRIDLVAQDL